MKKRPSASARIVAVTALALAAIVVIVAIGSAVGGGDSSSGKHGHHGKSTHGTEQKHHVPASYEIQSGDTLVSIAHRTGVPVREIEALNPEVDPQILIAGEELKLREAP
jgi:LysM repeat protein